jgi:Tfp pilus assembly protein PilV
MDFLDGISGFRIEFLTFTPLNQPRTQALRSDALRSSEVRASERRAWVRVIKIIMRNHENLLSENYNFFYQMTSLLTTFSAKGAASFSVNSLTRAVSDGYLTRWIISCTNAHSYEVRGRSALTPKRSCTNSNSLHQQLKLLNFVMCNYDTGIINLILMSDKTSCIYKNAGITPH